MGLMITWNEFLYNFGKIKRAKATEVPVVAIATKPKQFTSPSMRHEQQQQQQEQQEKQKQQQEQQEQQ